MAFFLSLASSAYLAHFNAPLMYAETRPDRDGSRLAPFRAAAAIAFSAAAALFISIGGAGFATFGEAVQALVINNYAAADPLAATLHLAHEADGLFEPDGGGNAGDAHAGEVHAGAAMANVMGGMRQAAVGAEVRYSAEARLMAQLHAKLTIPPADEEDEL